MTAFARYSSMKIYKIQYRICVVNSPSHDLIEPKNSGRHERKMLVVNAGCFNSTKYACYRCSSLNECVVDMILFFAWQNCSARMTANGDGNNNDRSCSIHTHAKNKRERNFSIVYWILVKLHFRISILMAFLQAFSLPFYLHKNGITHKNASSKFLHIVGLCPAIHSSRLKPPSKRQWWQQRRRLVTQIRCRRVKRIP